MLPWEVVKDLSEIIGAVGTAAIFSVRIIVKAKLRDESFTQKFMEMAAEIEELKKTKANASTNDLEIKYIRQELVEMRTDIKEGNFRMENTMEKVTTSLARMEGTVKTAMDIFTISRQKPSI